MSLNITSTSYIAALRLFVLVWGYSGVGKTSLSLTCPGKVLIVSAESGLLPLAGHNIDVIEISSWLEVQQLLNFLNQESTKATYQWIFIDSLTEAAQYIFELIEFGFVEAAAKRQHQVVREQDAGFQFDAGAVGLSHIGVKSGRSTGVRR